MSITLQAELGEQVRASARRAGQSLSSWLASAAATKLRAEALAGFLDEWEAGHGGLTPEDVARAHSELGLDAPPVVAAVEETATHA